MRRSRKQLAIAGVLAAFIGVAAAAVAQLHANPEFMTEFHAAQKEVEAARAAGKAGPDCSLEMQAAAKQ